MNVWHAQKIKHTKFVYLFLFLARNSCLQGLGGVGGSGGGERREGGKAAASKQASKQSMTSGIAKKGRG